jgi:hypothetical protein
MTRRRATILAVAVASFLYFPEVNGQPSATPVEGHPTTDWTHSGPDAFNQVHNLALLTKLRMYQQNGWDVLFSRTGKSVQQLIGEGQLKLQQLQSIVARDQQTISTYGPHQTLTLAPAQCSSDAKESGINAAVCDENMREDQINAITGILELLQDNSASLPQQVNTGRFGTILPAAPTIATVTIHVLPGIGLLLPNMGAGTATHTVDVSQNGQTIEARTNDLILVRLLHDHKRTPGFIVDPSGGIVEAVLGQFDVPPNRMILMKAVGSGTAKIAFVGPLQTVNGLSACSGCWSGYVGGGGPFTTISGNWTVPAVGPGANGNVWGASSTWIGLDGSGELSLIQTGTRQDNDEGGFFGIGEGTNYYAWFEVIAPPGISPEQPLNNNVSPGDQMVASISSTGPKNTSWIITISDTTPGHEWTFTSPPQSWSGPLDEADFIMEAPTNCDAITNSCNVQPLADYGQVVFGFQDRVSTNFGQPTSSNLGVGVELSIVQAGNPMVFSTPSAPDASGDSFSVTWSETWPNPAAISPGPWIETTALPPAQVNRPYMQVLDVFQATSPSWSLTGGVMPSGLSLSPGGIISGMPNSPGTYPLAILATDLVTGEPSQTQDLTILVSLNAESTLKLTCGAPGTIPSYATFAVQINKAPAACGGTVILSPGSYPIAATLNNVPADTYQILYGGACRSSSGSLYNLDGTVNLIQDQVAMCTVSAEMLGIVENGGCKNGSKCCAGGANGCRSCVPSAASCP